MKYIISLMVLMSTTAMAQELPVAPPATSLMDMANQAIFAVVSAFLLFVINYAKGLIASNLRNTNHKRGVAVVQDAFYSALSECNVTLLQTQSDAVVKSKVEEIWLGICLARLDDLYGFKKTDMKAWAKEQMGIFWGKLAAGKA